MKKDSLINTNPYLKDPIKLAEAVCRSVESSSAIEGIHVEVKAHFINGKVKFTASPKESF